jgi:hypothetical protein
MFGSVFEQLDSNSERELRTELEHEPRSEHPEA